jgi:hypothetical protein
VPEPPYVNPHPFIELFIGILFLTVNIFVHGAGVRAISQRFSRSWSKTTPTTPHWHVNLIFAAVIGAFALLHLFETLLWASPIYLTGAIASFRDSYYFVLENYTTLGDDTVNLPPAWQLIGPIIAMAGLFTFGWTGSVLVGIMSEFGRWDRNRVNGA